MDTIPRNKLVPARLVGGPCDGRVDQVAAFSVECWARLGKPGTPDAQWWARYDHNPLQRGEFIWSGQIIDTQTLGEALKLSMEDGNTYGEAYGA